MIHDIKITYLRGNDIDRTKWDYCIQRSHNGLIYGYSFYLDKMADNWDALVGGDYEIVMPLPYRSRFGIKYIYQPFLCAQLGVFGNHLTAALVEDFITAIPSSFRLVEISLNQGNFSPAHSYPRNNYVLDLQPSYESLFAAYRENSQRNIRKAYQLGCTARKQIKVEAVIEIALSQMKSREKQVVDNVERFRKLYYYLEEKQMTATYGIFSNVKELISSAVFFYSHRRAYYILVGNHANGRTIGASHALIDSFIKDHAGQPILLDFEGSDLRNLAFFYSSFGAEMENYPFLKMNRLPFFLKWLKK